MYEQENIVLAVPGKGYFEANLSQDPEYPGVDVEFNPENTAEDALSNPRIVFEIPREDDGPLRALIWSDTLSEDYTHEVTFDDVPLGKQTGDAYIERISDSEANVHVPGRGVFNIYRNPEDNYPGIDVEFTCEATEGKASPPRVVLEITDCDTECERVRAIIWGDMDREDYNQFYPCEGVLTLRDDERDDTTVDGQEPGDDV